MLTTCPECQTRFRLTPHQLEARRGLVRCGQCRAVFNAYDTLMPEPEAAAVIRPRPQADTSGALEPETDTAAIVPPKPEVDERADPWRVRAPGAGTPQVRAGQGAMERSHETGGQAPVVSTFTWNLPQPAGMADSILLSELPSRRPFPWAALGRGILAVGLVLVLAVQAVFFLRAELAARYPATRPYLERACAPLGCSVPLPRERNLLRVESSALESDPEHPARARLRVAFSNRATQTLAWPDLVLTLTDVRDAAVAQRVFRPGDYLPPQRRAWPGLPAREEIEIALDLDLGQLSAAGYRVRLDYF